MKNVNLTIDDRPITAREGDILLWVALENNIYIPNLCAIKEKERPSASCRLCFVEIEGYDRPVTSCTQRVKEGMVVRTRTPAVDRLVKTAFELLLSDHDLNCAKCPARKNCALMTIARERKLKMKLTRFKPLNRKRAIDDSTSLFTFDRNRCVLCGRCVWADREEAKVGAIGFSNRGLERMVTTFRNIPLADSPCTECGLCVEACPVGAMTFK
ncbi:MAG: 4Fe-4S binding protein [Firmicutes bacterium]|jgi:NADH dehydrogenase/NADH:ubiquinone oxidoreductase subunit G|nr:4Fe-4S binding protein [Bacillota bacterium]